MNSVGCDNGNSAGIIYGVMQEQSTAGCCTGAEYYYNRETCQCLPCTNIVDNCYRCNNQSVCFQCTAGYILLNNECHPECGNGLRTAD